MKRMGYFFFLIFLLAFQVFAHEGEPEPAPQKLSVAKPKSLEITKAVEQTVSGQKGSYHLTFLLKPAEPLVNLEMQLEVKVAKPLAKPDPLLGSEIPVEEATVTGEFVTKGFASSPVTAHKEEDNGFGLHFTATKTGLYQARVAIKIPGDTLTASLPFSVQPLPGTALASRVDLILLLLLVPLGILTVLFQAGNRTLGEALGASMPVLIGIVILGGIILLVMHRWVAPKINAPYEQSATVSLPALESGTVDVVEVPHQIQELLEIKVETVKRTSVHSYLDVPGKVTAPPQGIHELHSPVTGRVLSGSIPTVGQPVSRGQILAVVQQTLTAPEELQVQVGSVEVGTRLAQARSNLALKAKELERSQKLYAIGALALKDLQLIEAEYRSASLELQEAKRQLTIYRNMQPGRKSGGPLRDFPIISPVKGVVTTMDLTQGELISPDKRLFTLIDLSTVWVQGQIYEKDLAQVHLGDSANITVAAFPQKIFYGKLRILGSVVDPQSRTIQAIFELPNRQGELRDGMLAMIHLKAPSRTATTIPLSALVTEDGKSYVFIKESGTTFRRRQVSPGEQVGEALEILSGVSSGEQVVTEGAYSLAAQAKKQAKPYAQ